MQLTPTWMRLWLLCLANNEDYLAYCIAKRTDGAINFSSSNIVPDFIAELYVDFGDIYEDLATFSHREVKDWIESRRKLFFSNAKIVSFSTAQNHAHLPGHLLLDIELSEDINVTLKEIKRFVASAYLPEISYRMHTGKAGMLPLKPLARYALHGDCNMATLGRVKKAVTAGMLRHKDSPSQSKPLSITKTVLAIKKQKGNPFGWSMSEDDLDAERRGTFGKHILASSEVALLKRHRKDFAALVRNVIHGRFPDFT